MIGCAGCTCWWGTTPITPTAPAILSTLACGTGTAFPTSPVRGCRAAARGDARGGGGSVTRGGVAAAAGRTGRAVRRTALAAAAAAAAYRPLTPVAPLPRSWHDAGGGGTGSTILVVAPTRPRTRVGGVAAEGGGDGSAVDGEAGDAYWGPATTRSGGDGGVQVAALAALTVCALQVALLAVPALQLDAARSLCPLPSCSLLAGLHVAVLRWNVSASVTFPLPAAAACGGDAGGGWRGWGSDARAMTRANSTRAAASCSMASRCSSGAAYTLGRPDVEHDSPAAAGAGGAGAATGRRSALAAVPTPAPAPLVDRRDCRRRARSPAVSGRAGGQEAAVAETHDDSASPGVTSAGVTCGCATGRGGNDGGSAVRPGAGRGGEGRNSGGRVVAGAMALDTEARRRGGGGDLRDVAPLHDAALLLSPLSLSLLSPPLPAMGGSTIDGAADTHCEPGAHAGVTDGGGAARAAAVEVWLPPCRRPPVAAASNAGSSTVHVVPLRRPVNTARTVPFGASLVPRAPFGGGGPPSKPPPAPPALDVTRSGRGASSRPFSLRTCGSAAVSRLQWVGVGATGVKVWVCGRHRLASTSANAPWLQPAHRVQPHIQLGQRGAPARCRQVCHRAHVIKIQGQGTEAAAGVHTVQVAQAIATDVQRHHAPRRHAARPAHQRIQRRRQRRQPAPNHRHRHLLLLYLCLCRHACEGEWGARGGRGRGRGRGIDEGANGCQLPQAQIIRKDHTVYIKTPQCSPPNVPMATHSALNRHRGVLASHCIPARQHYASLTKAGKDSVERKRRRSDRQEREKRETVTELCRLVGSSRRREERGEERGVTLGAAYSTAGPANKASTRQSAR